MPFLLGQATDPTGDAPSSTPLFSPDVPGDVSGQAPDPLAQTLSPFTKWFNSVNWDNALQELVRLSIVTLIVLVVAYIANRVINKLIDRLDENTNVDDSLMQLIRVIWKWVLVIMTVAALLQVWGVLNNVWAAVTATVTLVAIGFFAVWSVLSNILCMVVLMFTRPFRVGEYVNMPALELGGQVYKIGLLHTMLVEPNGAHIQIPNNLFFQQAVRRYPRGVKVPELEEAKDAKESEKDKQAESSEAREAVRA